jgi:hypothetical protein
MTTSAAKDQTRLWDRRTFALLNPFMRVMLRLPLRSGRLPLVLLSFTGRKTGRRKEIPVSFGQDADGSLLVPGGGSWKWNLGYGRQLDVRYRGQWRQATSELVTDIDEIRLLVPRIVADNPRAESFIRVPVSAAGVPAEARLQEAVRNGFLIVRLRLDEPTEASGRRPTAEGVVRVGVEIGAVGLVLLGLVVWATESIYVVSVYWFVALVLAAILLLGALAAVARRRAGLDAIGNALLAVVPVIVAVTPVWWMYAPVGLVVFVAAEGSLRRDRH